MKDNNKNSNIYLPKERTDYNTPDTEFENKTNLKHENPASDKIVVNNIACPEFDYTEDMTDDE
ncbi:hypothetical protein [Clostridium sp. BJN0001]|uniref:hypothetical protein n=1 Tax=Clostridium sp. BJN0001 TaxID=2930219 RepID=UPI001FD0B412|nr:hypothetical protein [Clostridium sp. BJN0001]